MSLESQVAALVAETSTLTALVQSKTSEWDAALAAARAAIPELNRAYSVDAINGDDANAGTSAAPLRTLAEVDRRTPIGGTVVVTMLSDITLDTYISIDRRFWRVNGAVFQQANGRLPRLSFAPQIRPGEVIWLNRFILHRDSGLEFSYVELQLPSAATVPAAVGYGCPIAGYDQNQGGTSYVGFINSAVTDPAGTSVVSAIYPAVSIITINHLAFTYPAGKLLFGVAAGVDPNTVARIAHSTITSA